MTATPQLDWQPYPNANNHEVYDVDRPDGYLSVIKTVDGTWTATVYTSLADWDPGQPHGIEEEREGFPTKQDAQTWAEAQVPA